jgi:DICT domain-containing protein
MLRHGRFQGFDLDEDDPVRGEWVVAVVGTHYHGALIAKDLGDDDAVADGERRFSFVVTHDRATVLAAARSLLERVAPLDASLA